ARADHMNDANVVEANEHRDVAWQLSLHLCTDHVDRRNLQVWINLPDCLLGWRNIRRGRNTRRAPLIQDRIDTGNAGQVLFGNCRRKLNISLVERLNNLSLQDVLAIEPYSLESIVFIEAVVEETRAESNHH